MTAAPRYDDARDDLTLVGPTLSIYLYLFHDLLHPVKFRPVKMAAVVAHFGVSRAGQRRKGFSLRTVEASIRLLVEGGYIERERAGTGSIVRRYRLVYDKMP